MIVTSSVVFIINDHEMMCRLESKGAILPISILLYNVSPQTNLFPLNRNGPANRKQHRDVSAGNSLCVWLMYWNACTDIALS